MNLHVQNTVAKAW